MNCTHFAVACASIACASLALSAPPPGSERKPAKPPTPPAASQPSKPAATAPAKPAAGKRVETQPADPKWLDHLPKEDRAALDELLGWAPPAFTSDLEWIGAEHATWDSLRGKVVVLQSFTTANVNGRGWPAHVATALKSYDAKDVRIIALHTPEDAAGAKEFLTKKAAPAGVAVAIDPKGEFCDALGIYKRPVNILVDRNGAVRYAGLNLSSLDDAVKLLAAEPFQPDLVVAQREPGAGVVNESASSSSTGKVEFPPYTGKVDTAMDIRGKRAPDFHVANWMNGDAPNPQGKVVVVDFWATWCGPCKATVPHMNDLANKFRDDVVCIGISDEKKSEFESTGMDNLKKAKMTLKSFEYYIALDPSKAMYNAIQVRGIPTCLVMDRNWIVRWEGHPATLDPGTLEQIIKADKAAAVGGGGGASGSSDDKPAKPGTGTKRKKWTTG